MHFIAHFLMPFPRPLAVSGVNTLACGLIAQGRTVQAALGPIAGAVSTCKVRGREAQAEGCEASEGLGCRPADPSALTGRRDLLRPFRGCIHGAHYTGLQGLAALGSFTLGCSAPRLQRGRFS